MLSPPLCVLWNYDYSFHVLHEMFCYYVSCTHLPLSWLLTKASLSFLFVLALRTSHDWSVLSASCCLFYQKSFLVRNQWPEFMNTVWYMTGKILCCKVRTGMQSWSAECSSEDAYFFFCFFFLSSISLITILLWRRWELILQNTLQLGLLIKSLFYGSEKFCPSSLTQDLNTHGLTMEVDSAVDKGWWFFTSSSDALGSGLGRAMKLLFISSTRKIGLFLNSQRIKVKVPLGWLMLCSPVVKCCESDKLRLEVGCWSAGPGLGVVPWGSSGAHWGGGGFCWLRGSGCSVPSNIAGRAVPRSTACLPSALLLHLTDISAQGNEIEIIFTLPSLSTRDEPISLSAEDQK